MKNIHKIAAILAFFIGLMSIIAGSKVLLAIDTKNYNVLNWLVSYNVLFGFLSIVTAYFIWSKNVLLKFFLVLEIFLQKRLSSALLLLNF